MNEAWLVELNGSVNNIERRNGVNDTDTLGFIEDFKRMKLDEGIKCYFFKGIGEKAELILYFFYDSRLIQVSFDEGDYILKATNYNQVSSIELIASWHDKNDKKLNISLNKEPIILDSNKKEKQAKNIEEIYLQLCNQAI
ncbi:hypothetical protein [Oceanobacillus aidingensis]|uniref:Uncharacterized protein n=1 Tax=Oceanobacillus aidingensis TaxID=645964 RepID=A0ABV9JVB0_9BACI